MRGFKGKFVLLLIVFCAGYATAIYTLVPVPDDESCNAEDGISFSALQNGGFAQKCSVSLHKCTDVVKDLSCRAGEYIKEKFEECRRDT